MSIDSRRAMAIARAAVFAVLLSAVASFGGTPPVVQAASCKGASHVLSLSDGRATPATGTTSTSFAFSVRYTSNAGCAPTSITVRVVGVGTFTLTGPDSGFESGATFSTSRRLPVGTHRYSFSATSGSGSGERTATLSAVKPTAVTVVSSSTPQPKSTPVPTPAPAKPPRPTPRPTPTPAPASGPQPAPASLRPDATETPGPTDVPTPTPTAWPSATPAPSESAEAGLGGTGSGGSGGDPSSALGPWLSAGLLATVRAVVPPIAAWLASGLVGAALYAVLLRRRRTTSHSGILLVATASGHGGTGAIASDDPRPDHGETALPRWLRPSVQAARRGGQVTARAEPLVFTSRPAKGTERVIVDYRSVRLADGPDDLYSNEIDRLDRGDEVDVLGFDGAFAQVRTPTGATGWIPRHTVIGRRRADHS